MAGCARANVAVHHQIPAVYSSHRVREHFDHCSTAKMWVHARRLYLDITKGYLQFCLFQQAVDMR